MMIMWLTADDADVSTARCHPTSVRNGTRRSVGAAAASTITPLASVPRDVADGWIVALPGFPTGGGRIPPSRNFRVSGGIATTDWHESDC